MSDEEFAALALAAQRRVRFARMDIR